MKLNQYGFNSFVEGKLNSLMKENTVQGRVIAKNGLNYQVQTNEHVIEVTSSSLILGDYVTVTTSENQYQVVDTLKPLTYFNDRQSKVASNFDTVCIVSSVDQNFNLAHIEKCLNQAWDSGALPIIVLVNPTQNDSKDKFFQVKGVAAFVDIYEVNASSNDSKLVTVFKSGKSILLIGSNDYYKQYFIKKCFNVEIELKDNTIYPLPNGSVVMNINDETVKDLSAEVNHYQDIEDLANLCRFTDCTHTNEPGCQVIEAIQNGSLSEDRYIEYTKRHQNDEIEYLDEESDYKAYERKKSKEKTKFTKKNAKEDKLNAMSLT